MQEIKPFTRKNEFLIRVHSTSIAVYGQKLRLFESKITYIYILYLRSAAMANNHFCRILVII